MPVTAWDVEHDPDVRIEKDGDAVRQILHPARPFMVIFDPPPAEPNQLLARTYLAELADFLRITPPSSGPSPIAATPNSSRVALGPPEVLIVRPGESASVTFRQVHTIVIN